ncbi:MAG: ABC transporter ATP-binding protein [Deltaproteobacteria bacterium]|nr:ABC transporter ATP-binding protein [Deltaproteobacteria bacterium]
MAILEGVRVHKHFGGLAAISNVDFQVDRGEIVGLIGPNGAGKTTLFNLISGAVPLDAGEIRFKGDRISGKKSYQVRRSGVARTFQSVRIFPNVSVLENVILAAHFGAPGRRSSIQATQEALELLEFTGFSVPAATLAKDLPLAQQKKLEVARALASRPELLLLDEVIAGLNPTETSQAMELVTRIRDRGITILMIEHVMKAIMAICDRIIVLHYGVKLAEGPPAEIVNNPAVIEVYLGK